MYQPYGLRFLAGALLLALAPGLAEGFTPKSPEVKALIKRGLDFLERGAPNGGPLIVPGNLERLGEKVLAGLAFYKSDKPDHKLVKEAVQAIEGYKDWPAVDNYSLGLAIILLSELKDERHLPLIQKLVDELVGRQQQQGGFGYTPTSNMGDISQTQYAVLAFWSARRLAGAKVPQETIERVCDFLIRVQDPNGGWPYNGSDPGNYQRIPQTGITHSLTAGGLGSVCVCADLLGLIEPRSDEPDGRETGLPEALKVVKKPKAKVAAAPAPDTRIDRALVEQAIKDGENWFAQNYKIETGVWNYYYLYGLERCESFREHYYDKKTAEPRWYNDGVQFLAKKNQGGGWSGDHSAKATTSFAVLFLLRSSQQAIVDTVFLGDGILTSGKGLPTDLAHATVMRGKVIDSRAAEAKDIAILLENLENPELASILASNDEFTLDADSTKRSNQVVQLRSLVSAGNWEARMLAVRGLGKDRDLDNVPSLLYALTDPDVRVVREADAALRFVSRKLPGVGLPADPDSKAIQEARKAWRKWYLSIRPTAELLD